MDMPNFASYYTGETLKKLTSSWNKMNGFWKNEPDFWNQSLIMDFQLTDAAVTVQGIEPSKLYKLLYDFKKNMAGTFFSMHTKQFVKKMGFAPLLSLITGNEERFLTEVNNTTYTTENHKELQILAAYFGHPDLVEELTSIYNLTIDSNVLNMAIFSGKFLGEELRKLTKSCHPTYDSIRYAVHTGNVDILQQLMADYKLKPSADHFVVAAAVGSANMFHLLLKEGLHPEGELVRVVAAKSHNQEIIDFLEKDAAKESSLRIGA